MPLARAERLGNRPFSLIADAMPVFLVFGGLAVGGGVLGAKWLADVTRRKEEYSPLAAAPKDASKGAKETALGPSAAAADLVHLKQQASPGVHGGGGPDGCLAGTPAAGAKAAAAAACGAEGAAEELILLQKAAVELAEYCGHEQEEKAEFEIWVETEIESAWCLQQDGDSSSLPSSNKWREDCQTSTLRRRWNEFEEMTQQRRSGFGCSDGRRPSATLGAEGKAASCGTHAPRMLGGGPVFEDRRVASLRVLGLPTTANEAQVKAAYHKHCLAYHPDKGGDPAQFNALVAAYAELRSNV